MCWQQEAKHLCAAHVVALTLTFPSSANHTAPHYTTLHYTTTAVARTVSVCLLSTREHSSSESPSCSNLVFS